MQWSYLKEKVNESFLIPDPLQPTKPNKEIQQLKMTGKHSFWRLPAKKKNMKKYKENWKDLEREKIKTSVFHSKANQVGHGGCCL